MLDLALFHRVFHASARDLFYMAEAFLSRHGYTIMMSHEDGSEPEWMVATSRTPHNGIALVAHLDTIVRKDGVELTFSGGVVRNSLGVLGADDRAGVYAILDLIQRSEHRPPIIFTNHEEIGGVGAKALAAMPDFAEWVNDNGIKLFVELDRANERDFVYYTHELPNEIVEWAEAYGFSEASGSYSDVADLTRTSKVPHLNLSIGYRQQHGKAEWLSVPDMLWTQAKVWSMLYDTDVPAIVLTTDQIDGPPINYTPYRSLGYGSYRSYSYRSSSYRGSYDNWPAAPATTGTKPASVTTDADLDRWLLDDEPDPREDYRISSPTVCYDAQSICPICAEYTFVHNDWLVCQPCLLTDNAGIQTQIDKFEAGEESMFSSSRSY